MRWRYILYVVGSLVLFFGLTMLLPLAAGVYCQDGSAVAFLEAMGLTIAFGLIFFFIFRKRRQKS